MIWKCLLFFFFVFTEDERPLQYIRLSEVFEEKLKLPMDPDEVIKLQKEKQRNENLPQDIQATVDTHEDDLYDERNTDNETDNDNDNDTDNDNDIDNENDIRNNGDDNKRTQLSVADNLDTDVTDFTDGNTDDEDYAENDNTGHSSDKTNNDDFGFEYDDFSENIDNDKLFDDVIDNDESVNYASRTRKHRKKRSAHEQWKKSLPGGKPTVEKEIEPDVWQEVTDDDVSKAQQLKYKKLAEYVGITLLSVGGFVFVGICFLRDPVACIFAFGTGCPCCIVCCPCIRAFTDKYLNAKRMVRDKMNKYMPGVIVKDDGKLDYYEPTMEEVEILHEIVMEIADI